MLRIHCKAFFILKKMLTFKHSIGMVMCIFVDNSISCTHIIIDLRNH